jgi:hypothetical protein
MSRIPNSAMPHAGPAPEMTNEPEQGGGTTFADRASGLAELAREHPKTAIAAGAAVVAGMAAAAAIPLARSRRSSASEKSSGKRSTKSKS